MGIEVGSRTLAAGVAAILGLIVGSFINVVVHRVPRGESVVGPRSRCPVCGRPIAAWDNVPVLSWMMLRGRCRGCAVRISLRYPMVEAATGLAFAAVVLGQGVTPMTSLWLAFVAALITAALIDLEHHYIPDAISMGGLAVGLLLVPCARFAEGVPLARSVQDSVLGALLGAGLLWFVGFAHARVSVLLGRRFDHWPGEGEPIPRPGAVDYWTWFPGLGFGDVKLVGMIGSFVGPVRVVETICLAAGLGLVMGAVQAAIHRSTGVPFGFAPAITLAALAVLLAPGSILPLP